MRFLKIAVVVAGLCVATVTATAFASPTAPRNGAEYTTLKTPQPVQAEGKKVEVIEFFMYHCPACYALEPAMLAWVKKQGDSIVFRRIHLPLTGANDPEAHLFLTLEAMKLEESLHAKILSTWHVERRRLKSDDGQYRLGSQERHRQGEIPGDLQLVRHHHAPEKRRPRGGYV
jgi:thiol:disulfide interchange protein DsbA